MISEEREQALLKKLENVPKADWKHLEEGIAGGFNQDYFEIVLNETRIHIRPFNLEIDYWYTLWNGPDLGINTLYIDLKNFFENKDKSGNRDERIEHLYYQMGL